MELERWRKIEQAYHAAREREGEERAAFLAEACAGDEGLRQEVRSPLDREGQARSFLEIHALEAAGRELAREAGDQSRRESAPGMVGRTISHYRVLGRLGSGGMGVVYKAEDTRLRRPVALKLLPEGLEKDPEALGRLQREAQSASALNHPNICTIYDVGDFERRPFLAMELLEGQTLEGVISGRPLQVDLIVELAVQVAEALAAAHAKAIIHRDIKPRNIFVTTRGQAKVLDFGLAKQLPPQAAWERTGEEGGTALALGLAKHLPPQAAPGGPGGEETVSGLGEAFPTLAGAILGTAPYMSPEQARGERLDPRTDLFSFGAVLYEMATGRRAFAAETTPLILDAVLNREPESALALNPELPLELKWIIHRALEKDRRLRYQTASGLEADLKRLRRDQATGRAGRARHRALKFSDRTLLDLTHLIYAAAGEPALWKDLLVQLARVLNGNAASIHHQRPGLLESTVGETWNLDPDLLESYAKYYCYRNIWFTTRPEVILEGRVYSDEVLAPHEVLDRSEFCNDWLLPQGVYHVTSATVFQNESVSSNLSVFRPKGAEPFGEAECGFLLELVPHLRRAFQLHSRIQNLEGLGGAAADVVDRLGTGVILLDDAGRVLLVNRAARTILLRHGALKVSAQGVSAAEPSDHRVLQAAVSGAIATGRGLGTHAGGVVKISVSGSGSPLVLLVIPLRPKHVYIEGGAPVAAIFIADPGADLQPSLRYTEQIYGFTPAEARLANSLAAGKTLKEVSFEFGVETSTLRLQLKPIFAKTSTKRQSDLVRLLVLGPAGLPVK